MCQHKRLFDMILNVIKRLSIVLVAVLIVALIPIQTFAQQSELKYEISQDVNVAGNDITSVSYSVEVTGKPAGDQLKFSVAGLNLDKLNVSVNGGTVDASHKLADGDQLLPYSTVSFVVPESIKTSWKFKIEYQTSSLMQRAQRGGASLIVVAPQRSAKVTQEQLTLELPLSSELPVAFGLEPNKSTVDGELQRYSYKFDGSRNSAVVLQFSGAHSNSYTVDSTLKNSGWWWRTHQVALPADVTLQQSFLGSVTPGPDNVRLDQFGNMFVEYNLAPRSSLTLSAQITVKTQSAQYDLGAATNEVDAELYRAFLTTDDRYSGGQVKTEDSTVDLAKSLLSQAIANDQTVVELVASARASGLPAREVHGWIAAFSEAEPIEHAWTEVLIPDVGWVVLDPQMAQEFVSFGRSGSWRIRSAIIESKSTASELLTAKSQLVQLPSESDEEEVPAFEPAKPQIDSTNYVLFPGFSLRRDVVQMQAGVARDGLVLRTDSDQIKQLGSLAPLQRVVRSDVALAGASWSSAEQQVGTLEDEQFKSLADTHTKNNWWPLISLVIISGGVVAGRWFYGHRVSSKKSISLNERDEIDIRSAEQLLQSNSEDGSR